MSTRFSRGCSARLLHPLRRGASDARPFSPAGEKVPAGGMRGAWRSHATKSPFRAADAAAPHPLSLSPVGERGCHARPCPPSPKISRHPTVAAERRSGGPNPTGWQKSAPFSPTGEKVPEGRMRGRAQRARKDSLDGRCRGRPSPFIPLPGGGEGVRCQALGRKFVELIHALQSCAIMLAVPGLGRRELSHLRPANQRSLSARRG